MRKKAVRNYSQEEADRQESVVNEIITSYHQSFRSPLATMNVIREGISSQALVDLMKVTGATQTELARILSLTEPTLRKYIRDGRKLDSGLTDRIVQLFELFEKGIDTFGSLAEFRNWLPCHNIGLGAKPIDLLDSFTGVTMVRNELIRIDHGILA